MAAKPKFTANEQRLIRRYLVWCYKTTKEELDKIDRYFTQLQIDAFMLKQLTQTDDYQSSAENTTFVDRVDQFREYMRKKETNVLTKKFTEDGKTLDGGYQYLNARFLAIERAIRHFLGDDSLREITQLYEMEMTRRILEAREHT